MATKRLCVNGPKHGKVFDSPALSIQFPVVEHGKPGFSACAYGRGTYLSYQNATMEDGEYPLWTFAGGSPSTEEVADAVRISGFKPV